jgi:hypothetical protein
MNKKINLHKIFESVLELIEFHKLNNYLYEGPELDEGSEIYLFENVNAFGLRLWKSEYPFLMLYIENNEWVFMINQFQSENQIIELINNFIKGEYNYKLESDRLKSLIWNDPILSNFDLHNDNMFQIKSRHGFDWTKGIST